MTGKRWALAAFVVVWCVAITSMALGLSFPVQVGLMALVLVALAVHGWISTSPRGLE